MRILLRGGTAAEWSTANPTLANREVGVETDTHKIKVGDGSTAWNSLSYLAAALSGVLDDLSDVTITAAASGDILRHNGTAWVDAVGTTYFEVAGAVAAHEADTTSVHGIADTSTLYRSGGTDVAVTDGGTGASDAAGARTNLGLVIGTDVQAYDADLAALAAISPSQGDIIYHNGTAWVRLAAGTSGQYLQTQGAAANPQWATASSSLVYPVSNISASEAWISQPIVTSWAYATITLNRLYCLPMVLRSGTLVGIGQQNNTTAASSVLRLGIYSDNGSGYPGALLVDAGTIDLSATTTFKSITISQAVTSGLYWVAAVIQGSATPTVLTSTAYVHKVPTRLGGSGNVFDKHGAFVQDSVSGALPANFTSTPAGSGDGTQAPGVFLRY